MFILDQTEDNSSSVKLYLGIKSNLLGTMNVSNKHLGNPFNICQNTPLRVINVSSMVIKEEKLWGSHKTVRFVLLEG